MSLLVVGLSHHTAPVEVLEQTAVSADALTKSLEVLGRSDHLSEVVVLSTCNRTEVYAHATRFHPALDDVTEFLSEHAGVTPDALTDTVYSLWDDDAVVHLFGVASGIDSMIVGESEILGQVRDAWKTANDSGSAGPLLDPTFRHAIEVGRRARSETGVGRGAASISSAAVDLAEDHLGSLEGRRVVVVGAGRMAEGMVGTLLRMTGELGIGDLVVANRTLGRGSALAERGGGRAIGLDRTDELIRAIAEADLLLTSTGSEHVVLTRGDVELAMRDRDRPLLVVDVAVPRDVDPGVDQVFGVMRCDIDDLAIRTDGAVPTRSTEVERVRTIITTELDRFRLERLRRRAVPIIRALREHTDDLRTGELERFRSRIAELGPEGAKLVDEITRALMNTVLHEPTVRLKDAAGTATGELLAESLAALFDLDVDATGMLPTEDVREDFSDAE